MSHTFEPEPTAVPTFCYVTPDNVFPYDQQVSHVVSLKFESVFIASPSWCQKLIAYSYAIDFHLIQPESGDGQTSSVNWGRKPKRLAD